MKQSMKDIYNILKYYILERGAFVWDYLVKRIMEKL